MFDPVDIARALATRQGVGSVQTVPDDEWIGKDVTPGSPPPEFLNPPKHERFEYLIRHIAVSTSLIWNLQVPAEVLEFHTTDTAATDVMIYLGPEAAGFGFHLKRAGSLVVPGLGLYQICIQNLSAAVVADITLIARNKETPFSYSVGNFA